MTFSNDMLETARRAGAALGAATDRVRKFVESRRAAGGGFHDRAGRADLYYTVFGIDCLLALGDAGAAAEHEAYVRSFGQGGGLDFVHLACLARCRARISGPKPGRREKDDLRRRLDEYRTPDGGYATVKLAASASVSGTFLAFQALDDLGLLSANPLRAMRALAGLRARDGAYANEPGLGHGTTLATAGAVILWSRLHLPVDPAQRDWLVGCCHREGGFLANPRAPVPDLLSTATALYALERLGQPLDEGRRRACLHFVETVMDESGGFRGHWMDNTPDCEYTFYALLALGCLASGRWSAP